MGQVSLLLHSEGLLQQSQRHNFTRGGLIFQKTRNTVEESVISVATSCNHRVLTKVPSALGQPGWFETSNN